MSRHRLNESSSFIYDIRLRRRASIRNDAPIGDVDEHYRSFAWIGDSDRYSDDSDATATVPLDDAMVPLAETAIAPAVAAGAYDAATIPVSMTRMQRTMRRTRMARTGSRVILQPLRLESVGQRTALCSTLRAARTDGLKSGLPARVQLRSGPVRKAATTAYTRRGP